MYLGISIPTYLKLCANLTHACGTHVFSCFNFGPQKKVVHFLSPLSKFGPRGVFPLHFLSFSSLSMVSLHLLHPYSPPPSKSSIEGQERSLEFQDFWRSKGLELRVQAWKGFGSTITRIQDLSSLPSQNLALEFLGVLEFKNKDKENPM